MRVVCAVSDTVSDASIAVGGVTFTFNKVFIEQVVGGGGESQFFSGLV